MADNLHINIVTPSSLYLTDTVEMVVIPGEQGDFGVLKDHVPFISMIRPGVIEIIKEKGAATRLFVSDGYAETHGDQCTILAEHVEDASGLTREAAQKELDAARKSLERASGDAERIKAEKAITIAETKLLVC